MFDLSHLICVGFKVMTFTLNYEYFVILLTGRGSPSIRQADGGCISSKFWRGAVIDKGFPTAYCRCKLCWYAFCLLKTGRWITCFLTFLHASFLQTHEFWAQGNRFWFDGKICLKLFELDYLISSLYVWCYVEGGVLRLPVKIINENYGLFPLKLSEGDWSCTPFPRGRPLELCSFPYRKATFGFSRETESSVFFSSKNHSEACGGRAADANGLTRLQKAFWSYLEDFSETEGWKTTEFEVELSL